MDHHLSLRFAALAVLVVGSNAVGCGSKGGASYDTSEATLRKVQTCSDLESALREDAREKMHRYIDAQIRGLALGYYPGYYGSNASVGAIAQGGAADKSGAATPSASGAAGTSTPTTSTATATSHSDTNTQVTGVDEADFVKNDGKNIYLLHGGKLLVLNAWPSDQLAQASGTDVEGQPIEMFVSDGKIVVYSTVAGETILSGAGVKARPAYQDQNGSYGYAYASAVAGSPYASGYTGLGATPLTKVTVFTLNGTTPSVTREIWYEGTYTTSRRTGSKVLTVLNGGLHGPTLNYSATTTQTPSNVGPSASPGKSASTPATPSAEDLMTAQIMAWQNLRADNDRLLDGTALDAWLPYSFSRSGTGFKATTTACDSVYVPVAGSTQAGFTQIDTFDLGSPSTPPSSAAIVGGTDTVYANDRTLVLASRAYTDPWIYQEIAMAQYSWPTTAGQPAHPPSDLPAITTNWSHLHAFDLTFDPIAPTYIGSGRVAGTVQDQFALDEKNGAIRVTTTEQRYQPVSTPNAAVSNDANGQPPNGLVSHLFTLTDDRGRLNVTGDIGDLAPNETLYSTRFVGDKAYICTFRVHDPLFVVDVADATAPKVLAALTIPGFSEYMQPLDDTHLLTIGRETHLDGTQHDSQGRWYGLALQLFDVTSPTEPKLTQKVVFGNGYYPTSEAETNHKAFTYFADKKLLAFPFMGQEATSGSTVSTLELYKVDTSSIAALGRLDQSTLLTKNTQGAYGYCGGAFGEGVRRGLFLDDVVYSISYAGVVAAKVDDLTTPVKSLPLSPPEMTGYSCAPQAGGVE